MAALQGKSIKEYVLERVLTPNPNADTASDEDLRQLEAFLELRLAEAETGKIVNSSIEAIFKDVSDTIG